MRLFAHLLSRERSEKTFQPLNRFFWLSCRTGNASLKSGRLAEKKLFSLGKVCSHTFRHFAVAPQHLAEGLGRLNAPWLCVWWCSHTWDNGRLTNEEHADDKGWQLPLCYPISFGFNHPELRFEWEFHLLSTSHWIGSIGKQSPVSTSNPFLMQESLKISGIFWNRIWFLKKFGNHAL